MRPLPLPGFVARASARTFTASFSATVAHDDAPATLGAIRSFHAVGPLTLPDGPVDPLNGDAGGVFSISEAGGEILVAFDRDGLGDALREGEARRTAAGVAVSDGANIVTARLQVTVRRPLSPPVLLSAIPDQTDMTS